MKFATGKLSLLVFSRLIKKEGSNELLSNLDACNAELEKSSRKIVSVSFNIDRFKSHPSSVQYYTGIPTIEHLDSYLANLKSSAASMRYYKPGVTESKHASNKPGPATKLSLREQFFSMCPPPWPSSRRSRR